MQKNYKNFLNILHTKNNDSDSNTIVSKNFLDYKITNIKSHLMNQSQSNKSNQSQTQSQLINKSQSNRGFYIPYSLLYPDTGYEFLHEVSCIIKNTNRSSNSNKDMFKWKNVLDTKIKNLMFLFIHILIIPMYPWIEKNKTSDINQQISNYLIQNKKNLSLNQVLNFVSDNLTTTVNVSYIDDEFIDFSLNYDYSKTYSIEFNTNNIYLYTRSKRKIIDEHFLYIDIDSNNNFNHNIQLNTSLLTKKFSFKVIPITITSSYVYYKALGQFIFRSLNDLINVDYFDINIYSESYKPLSNIYINKKLMIDTSKNIINHCDCIESDDLDKKTNASCYCNYIRHPLNKNNQIDIGFKMGLIQNELINNIFH